MKGFKQISSAMLSSLILLIIFSVNISADDFFQRFVGHITILLFGKIILPKTRLVEASVVLFNFTNKFL